MCNLTMSSISVFLYTFHMWIPTDDTPKAGQFRASRPRAVEPWNQLGEKYLYFTVELNETSN